MFFAKLHSFFAKKKFKIFSDTAKVWPSAARTNLFETEKLHHLLNDSDSSDCEERVLEITELHKSISSASLESFTLIGSQTSSKANFLLNAPSNSAASLNDIQENVNEMPTQSADEVTSSKNNHNEDEDSLGIGYTRSEIKRRLNNLVKLSFKNFSGDPEVGEKSKTFGMTKVFFFFVYNCFFCMFVWFFAWKF